MTFKAKIKQVKNHIIEKTEHPYLDQFISKPMIDEDKIMFLLTMFNENGTYRNISDYVTAIMIMQMALDMHDTVGIDAIFQTESRKRQLTVLAGDFYSSQYYCMLSEKKAFSMIRSISRGIRTLNEDKVELFRGKWQWEEFLPLMSRIENALMLEMADFLGLTHWAPLFAAYFTHKRLLSEKRAIQQGDGTAFMAPLFYKNSKIQKQIVEKCDGWLINLKDQVESELDSGILRNNELGMLLPIWMEEEYSLSSKKQVEEGFK